jgi:transcriptional regulator with XRE-family HTH domain
MEDIDLKKEIGHKIRGKRGKIRQKDFAKLVGVHKDQLSRYETGKSIPRPGIYQRIMKFEPFEKETPRVEEPPGIPYEVQPTEIKKLLDKARKILESDNDYAVKALKSNIDAFFEMIRASDKDNENKGGD